MISLETADVLAQQAREGAPVVPGIAIGGGGGDRAMVVELERVVAVIGDCAVDLVRDTGQRGHRLAGLGLRHRDLAHRRLARAETRRGLPRQQAAHRQIAIHPGAVMLHPLEAADRASELHPGLRVVQGQVERGLTDAHQFG